MRMAICTMLLLYGSLHRSYTIQIIRHANTSLKLQQRESHSLFCATDEEYETCSWFIQNEFFRDDCNGCSISYVEINAKHGNQCNACMENISWNVTSKSCGIDIIQLTPLYQGEYRCVVKGFYQDFNQEIDIHITVPEDESDQVFMDYLLAYIVPGIVISVMLILALVLACILRRKQRAGKLNLFYSESLPPRDPVILEDELTTSDREVLFNESKFIPRDESNVLPFNNSNSVSIQGKDHDVVQELDKLLKLDHAPIHIDPYSFSCNSRPSPSYKKRNVI